MIVVQSPLKRDYIKSLLDQKTHDGITFTFAEEKGLKIYFTADIEDTAKAASVAKKVIKASEVGTVLYFTVTHE